ncbi:TPA: 50S ribosomal protein L23 [Patescibacteria group bacterium]|nr:50S ribosomal protein L23 [Patescibacteria group bacterium]
MLDVPHSGLGNKGLIVPRISEKAGFVDRFNQYIFTVYGKLNKIEVRRAVEKMYGVKVANVNMIQVQGKSRTFGRKVGQRSGFKKAMITLTKDSKKINIVEPT